jgi:hypothetical protein
VEGGWREFTLWISEGSLTNLKQARDEGKLDQFAKDHEADAPGDEAAFNATLASMAGTSKAVPEASPPGDCDD